jgi:hypothetical protein
VKVAQVGLDHRAPVQRGIGLEDVALDGLPGESTAELLGELVGHVLQHHVDRVGEQRLVAGALAGQVPA